MSKVSPVRQNFHQESEAGVNKQINLELHASYVYQQMVSRTTFVFSWFLTNSFQLEAYHFDRDDVALPGFHKYFKQMSDEERGHAEKLMEFQNKRGGRIVLQDIPKPTKQEWNNGLEAMEAALELEKTVNQALLDLHKIATQHQDPQVRCCLKQVWCNSQPLA